MTKRIRVHNLLKKARDDEARGRRSRKSAMEAMCWTCMGGSEEHSAGVREEIKQCTSPKCPLYSWRPLQ